MTQKFQLAVQPFSKEENQKPVVVKTSGNSPISVIFLQD